MQSLEAQLKIGRAVGANDWCVVCVGVAELLCWSLCQGCREVDIVLAEHPKTSNTPYFTEFKHHTNTVEAKSPFFAVGFLVELQLAGKPIALTRAQQ